MTTIYKFAKLLDDDLDNKYILGYEGAAAKEYVALADYQAQQDEIAKLRGLLERWRRFGPTIDICLIYKTIARLEQNEEVFNQLIISTTEALK